MLTLHLESAKLRALHALHALMPHVHRASCTLVPCVPRTVRTLVPHVPCPLRVSVSHVPPALRALVSYLSCTLGAHTPLVPYLLQLSHSEHTLICLMSPSSRVSLFFVFDVLAI